MSNSTLGITGNEITRNQFIGEASALFYINGGIALVEDNKFSYNGMLKKVQLVNNFTAIETKRQFYRSKFPWEDYDFLES